MKRIGDILTRNKTQVEVEGGTSYKQVTIRTNYKGVVLRGTQDGSTILTKNQFAVSAGQFILSRIDARNGAFGIIPDELEGAIITNDFLAFDINEDEVEREFFNVFLQSPVFLEACIKASRGNTNRKRVNETFFLDYEVNLPPLAEQHQLIKQINKARANLAIAQHEIAHQEALLGNLKQAILQEAIQGKLTESWRAANPDTEPASELLKRIQKEKARLIADKKLRPDKPLPKISPSEIPFEIPKSWEWCRLDEFLNVRAGIAKGGKHYTGVTTPTPYLRVANVQRGYLDLDVIKFLDIPASEVKKYALEDGDLLVTEGGDPDKVGRCAVWRNEIEGCVHQNHIFSMRPIAKTSLELEFVPLMLNSPFCQTHFLGSYKQTTNLASINKTVLRSTPIPLPPLAEQAVIVERVEALMETVRALETEIEHSRTHATHLLQAVLKEAFAPAS
jgi:type I restriction enzyme S subunit